MLCKPVANNAPVRCVKTIDCFINKIAIADAESDNPESGNCTCPPIAPCLVIADPEYFTTWNKDLGFDTFFFFVIESALIVNKIVGGR